MKKVILAAISLMFITSSAFAASIGISGTAMYFDASGTETTKSSSQKNSKSEDGVVPIPSFFIETEAAGGNIIGLDIVPFSASVADFNNARTDTDTDDASDTAGNNKGDVNFKNLVTLYLEKPLDTGINGSFIKLGLSRVTIETDETVATGSTYGDESVMGVMIGFGAKRDLANGAFMKLEGQVSHYQGATFDGSADSDSVKNKIELDDFTTAGLKVSVGKSF